MARDWIKIRLIIKIISELIGINNWGCYLIKIWKSCRNKNYV
jgi:hypothetical protein